MTGARETTAVIFDDEIQSYVLTLATPKPTEGATIEAEQDIGDLAESEVAPPPDEVAGQLLHEAGESDALGATRQFPNPRLEPGERLRRDDPLGRRSGREAEAQEGPRRWAVHRALGCAHRQLQPPGEPEAQVTAAQRLFSTEGVRYRAPAAPAAVTVHTTREEVRSRL